MGLQEIIKGGVDIAFGVIDDLLTNVKYFRYDSSENDLTTGEVITNYTQQRNVKVLFEDYRVSEVDGENIKAQDKKVSIPYSNVTWEPKSKDKLREASGQEWRVVEYDRSTDPIRAMHVLQCRRIQ